MEFLAHEELESLKIASGDSKVVKLYECFDRRTCEEDKTMHFVFELCTGGFIEQCIKSRK